MVKSPWKLLTGLLSREKTAEPHDVGQASFTENVGDVEAPEASSTAYVASIGGAPTPEQEPSSALQAREDKAGDRQEPLPPIMAEGRDAMSAEGATVLAPDRTVVGIRAIRRNRRDRAAPTTRRKTKAVAPYNSWDAETAAALADEGAQTEPDPVRALDREIQELRFELAVKLRLQNDQLTQMLSRFEPK